MPAPPPELLAQYQALANGGAFAHLGQRTQLEFTGADRASFLHNLSTNEVKKLQPGDVRETFITNVQGRTIGHGYVICRPDTLIFDTVPEVGPFLLAHFEKYHIREKVEIRDVSGERGELLVSKSTAVPPIVCNDIRHIHFVGANCCFLSAPLADIPRISAELLGAGLVECTPQAVEMARVEFGTPLFGRDITDKNLPQEVARDKQAISFTKGCYLGQETVARIDALGHVNQLLVGVSFGGDAIPSAGTELTTGDKVVGHVTSSAWSPRLSTPLALAYMRREHSAVGTTIGSKFGVAQVVVFFQ